MILINTPSLALQKTQNTILKSDPIITQFVSQRVYDDIPRGTPFPYIQIGDNQDVDNSNTCDDTPTEVFSRIHVWVRGAQRGIIADQISHRIRTILGKDTLSLDDYKITVANFVNTDSVVTENELEIQNIVTLRYLIQKKII